MNWWSSYNFEMREFRKYLYLQIKRAAGSFPWAMLSTLLLAGILSILCAVLIHKEQQETDSETIRIGVTGATKDPYFEKAMLMLQVLEMGDIPIELQVMSEQEAAELMKEGGLTGYVIIPQGFVESIVSGENKTVQYVSANGQAGFDSMITREVLTVVSSFITESQSGIYGMQKVYRRLGLEDVLSADELELNIRYIKYIIGRERMIANERIGRQKERELSLTEYYFCSIWLFLLLVWGISATSLFSSKNPTLQGILRAKGVSALGQITGEYMSYLALMMANLFFVLLLLLGMIFLGKADQWLPLGTGEMISFFWCSVPVVLAVSSLEFLLYELAEGFVNSILAQFLCAVSLGYLSGCFYPLHSLPENIQTLSVLLPTGIAMSYLSGLINAKVEIWLIGELTAYACLFLLTAAGTRELRIRCRRENA